MKSSMNISKVHCPPHLRCLVPVLKRWIKLNGQLAEQWYKHEDCPWWYKERALLGTFCGSLWLSRSVLLEEYSDSKRGVNRRGQLTPNTSYTGRVDLYFEVGKQRFVAESKHVWVPATSGKQQKDNIKACIERTSGDVGQIAPDGDVRRLAIVFAVPYIRSKGKSPLTPRDLKDKVLWSVKQAQISESYAMAWAFPRLGRYGKYKGSVYPGVIMLLKEVKRAPH